MTDTPPVVPARMSRELDLGPACDQCGGMMQRTGSLLHVHAAAATTPAAADLKAQELRQGCGIGKRAGSSKRLNIRRSRNA